MKHLMIVSLVAVLVGCQNNEAKAPVVEIPKETTVSIPVQKGEGQGVDISDARVSLRRVSELSSAVGGHTYDSISKAVLEKGFSPCSENVATAFVKVDFIKPRHIVYLYMKPVDNTILAIANVTDLKILKIDTGRLFLGSDLFLLCRLPE